MIYANHERGFTLISLRSPTITRMYLQCDPEENIDEWPDERIWDEIRARLAGEDTPDLVPGPVLQKGRDRDAFLRGGADALRHALPRGDSAHIVPPTGAKGMNLAIADVRVLAAAFGKYYGDGARAGLDAYSDVCLDRIWKTQRFSWWMTSMLHRFEGTGPFEHRVQLAELDYVTSSRAGLDDARRKLRGLALRGGLGGAADLRRVLDLQAIDLVVEDRVARIRAPATRSNTPAALVSDDVMAATADDEGFHDEDLPCDAWRQT